MVSRGVVVVLAMVLSALSVLTAPYALAGGALAQDPSGELFGGGHLSHKSWISWAGAVQGFAPAFTGRGSLYQSGWRLRGLVAYGQYGLVTDGQPNIATPMLFEITPGVQLRSGPLISKLYLGLHGEQHRLDRPDPGSRLRELGYGVKIISENWLNLPMNSNASLDLSFSTLNTSYQAMLRLGSAHFVPRLTLGPEAQLVGNGEYYQLRLGSFARWKLAHGQIEASGGISRNYDQKTSPYISLSWLKHF